MGILSKIFGKRPLPKETIPQKNMSGGKVKITENIAPGELVPKSGQYKCNVCMEGGMIDLLIKSDIEGGRIPEIPKGLPANRENIKTVAIMLSRRTYPIPGLGQLNEVLRRRLSNGETILSFQQGQKFVECPNCGSVTGWTNLVMANDYLRSYKMSLPD